MLRHKIRKQSTPAAAPSIHTGARRCHGTCHTRRRCHRRPVDLVSLSGKRVRRKVFGIEWIFSAWFSRRKLGLNLGGAWRWPRLVAIYCFFSSIPIIDTNVYLTLWKHSRFGCLSCNDMVNPHCYKTTVDLYSGLSSLRLDHFLFKSCAIT